MRRHLWSLYLTGVALAMVGYAWQSDAALLDLAWLAIAWSAVAATLVGLAVHRPAERGPWVLTASGLSATGLAGIVAPASQDLVATSLRAVAGDVLHLSAYVMIGAAVLWFVRLQTPDDDRDSVIDGVIVAVALATVLWSVVIDPTSLGAGSTLTERAVYVVAPLLPAGVTALCVRLLFAAGGRLASARLLGTAWILAFLGSIGWILLLQSDAVAPGGWTDLLWVAALGCAGASALHPSMVEMSHPTVVVHRTVSVARLTVLGLAILATPGALLSLAGAADVHVVVPVVGAGLIALLVLYRLARLVHERERAHVELESRAARQEAVATLGEAALGDRPLASMYAEAAVLAAGVLDDVKVTVGSEQAGVWSGEHAVALVRLPIDGDLRAGLHLEVTGSPTRALSADERSFLKSVAAVLSGMTARRNAEDDLRQQALHDGLTGLPNRVLILERLEHAIKQRARATIGVLFIDLDGFKPINDHHGHVFGDTVLTILADRLADVIRDGDTVGRLAGDEFVVIAPDCDRAGLADLAERLLRAVRVPVEVDGDIAALTASIGIAIADADEQDPLAILRRADSAMYEAKAAGGGTTAAADRGGGWRGDEEAAVSPAP